MTSSGGTGGGGTIFSFNPVTNTLINRSSFSGSNGRRPQGSLVKFNDKLYGMTTNGGTNNVGTIFSFNPDSINHTKLFDFNISNGSFPFGGLVEFGGLLYGMTSSGGVNNDGIIFSFDPTTNTHVKLFDFNKNLGFYPKGSLTIYSGKLYGMTVFGGKNNDGTIFSFEPSTNIFTKLFDFDRPTSGNGPNGDLIVFGDKLYGLASSNGSAGNIFSYDPATGTHLKLFDFSNPNGIGPLGSLKDLGGKLFGMTVQGGKNFKGTIFSFDPTTNIFTKIRDFDGVNGALPESGAFIEFDPTTPSISITSPGNNNNFPSGSDITLRVYASNPGGSVAYVDFFEQGNKLGSDSTAPYTFTGRSVRSGSYRVSAIAITNTYDTLRTETITINVLTGCNSSGTILGEGYINIFGGSLSNLLTHPSYPENPYVSAHLSTLEYANLGDEYGGMLRGYICAPVTGNYVFYISGDDQAQLWVSTNDNPALKRVLAYTNAYTGFRQWDKFSAQQSHPIRLIAGQRYYIETLHVDYVDADHLSVGWKLPDGTFERPIPSNRLSPYIPSGIGGQAAPNGFAQDMRAALNTQLTATVLPNPSRNTFTVSLKGKEGTPIQAVVTDILGRVIETKRNLQPNGQLQMGQNWKPGIYILQLQQGDQRTILKLIKE
jgi:uncharacterized repeat protein (TIGR03803 family)